MKSQKKYVKILTEKVENRIHAMQSEWEGDMPMHYMVDIVSGDLIREGLDVHRVPIGSPSGDSKKRSRYPVLIIDKLIGVYPVPDACEAAPAWCVNPLIG